MKKGILRIISTFVCALVILIFATTARAAERTAVVHNLDPADRLNLRTKPSETAITLGKYYNGVNVELLGDVKDGWVKVRFYNLEGYMKAEFLEYGADQPYIASAMPSAKINNAGGTGLNLRKTQSSNSASLGLYKNGSTVVVYGVGETWCHVETSDGKVGFMLRENLSPLIEFNTGTGKSSSTGGSGSRTNAVVNNPNLDDRLNLRTKPSEGAPTLGKYYNGTFVEVLSDEKDGWVKVRIFGLEGYMMAKFLVTQDQIPIGAATVPTCTIDTVDGTGLTLYKTQSEKNTSLGLYPYGQTVRVFGLSETWCHVQTEDGNTGFMQRTNLSPVLEYDKSK